MESLPKPPKIYESFVRRYPTLAEAWEKVAESGREGPLDEKTIRLLKLALAMGAMRQGSLHSSVRKALALGISVEEIEQIIALAAGTVGFPSTVAIYSWVQDVIDTQE